MANAYTQIYIHVIFSVKVRQNLLKKENKEGLHKYITGIVKNKSQKFIAINTFRDHVHILIGLKPDCPVSSIVRDIKANSSSFINKKKWITGKFEWQRGF